MKQINIFNKKETAEVFNKLRSQFGIEEIHGQLVQKGARRIFLFQGDFPKGEVKKLERIVDIDRIGAYIGKVFLPTGEFRLSIEGTQIFKEQISKNIVEIDDKQAQKWMEGDELQIKTDLRGIVVIKYGNDFLGCGKASAEKISNFVPKIRRLKKKGN